VAVVAVLTPFADTVRAPVAAGLRLGVGDAAGEGIRYCVSWNSRRLGRSLIGGFRRGCWFWNPIRY